MKARIALIGSLFAAMALGSLTLGCNTPVRIGFDEEADFSEYRSWDWLPDTPARIVLPDGDPVALHARVTELVERQLARQGFPRSILRPDFYVTYRIALRREEVRVHSTPAPQSVHSGHMEPPITIHSTETELRTYEYSHLEIAIADGYAGRLLWYGGTERRVRNAGESHLREAISSILERFPPTTAVAGRVKPDEMAPRILTVQAFLSEPWGEASPQ